MPAVHFGIVNEQKILSATAHLKNARKCLYASSTSSTPAISLMLCMLS
jgi:hypothetical protein